MWGRANLTHRLTEDLSLISCLPSFMWTGYSYIILYTAQFVLPASYWNRIFVYKSYLTWPNSESIFPCLLIHFQTDYIRYLKLQKYDRYNDQVGELQRNGFCNPHAIRSLCNSLQIMPCTLLGLYLPNLSYDRYIDIDLLILHHLIRPCLLYILC